MKHIKPFLYALVLSIQILDGKASANPAVIAELAKNEVLFTAVVVKSGDTRVLMIDRVLKGGITPLVMAHVKLRGASDRPIGSRCLFIFEALHSNKYEIKYIIDGKIIVNLNGRVKYFDAKEIIDALDETLKVPDRNVPEPKI